MIVGIDLRCLPTEGEGAGIAHAARFLTDAVLSQNVPWTWQLYVPSTVGNDAWTKRSTIVGLKDATGSSLRTALRLHPCDVLLVPGGAVAPGLSVPAVPWVHDLAIYANPEWFPESVLRRVVTTRLFRRGVTAAPIVFTVSSDTRQGLVRLFGLDQERIRVTLEGGDPVLATLHGDALAEARRRAESNVASIGITNPFILALGTVEPRKNLAMLIRAWTDAQTAFGRPTDLVIAGREGWKTEEVRDAIKPHIVPEKGMSRLHRIESVDDATRRDLLLAADLVALPSLHEGFGLVALEAMQAGTPVVASRRGAIPEVVGDAGVFLDPHDANAWSQALVRLAGDDDARKDLGMLGKARSQGFTWERVAKIVIDGLRGVR